MLQLVIVALMVCAVLGREFRNPVLNGSDYPDPGVILYNGLYYAVTTSNNNDLNKFPIHVSNDLQNWTFFAYALPEGNYPSWSISEAYAPEIYHIDKGEFRLFFGMRDRDTQRLAIAVATSYQIFGPYVVESRPLQLDPNQDSFDATMVQDGGQKFLVWRGNDGLYARELYADCLELRVDSEAKLIMRHDLPWEGGQVGAPWFVHRPDGWYMFYSGHYFCSDRYAVGVARSQSPLGPFEKRGDPILTSTDDFKGPGHCSVVHDMYIDTTVMVYHAYGADQVCREFPRFLMSQSVGWENDGWPFMIPN